jgi:hypothetical protein
VAGTIVNIFQGVTSPAPDFAYRPGVEGGYAGAAIS